MRRATRRAAAWGVLAVLIPIAAMAEVRSGREVTLGADEQVRENLHVFAENVNIEGDVKGDLIAFGRNVRISGNVTGDILGAAQTLTVEGAVGGSVRVAGADVSVMSAVKEDLLAAGANVQVGPAASIKGEALMAGNELRLDGSVGKSAYLAGNELKLNAPIGGDLRAEANSLEILSGAKIGGNVVYRSGKASVTSGVPVGGDVQRLEGRGGDSAPGFLVALYLALRGFVGLFALGLLFYAFFPRFARQAPAALIQRPLRALGMGTVTLFGLPLLAIGIFALGVMIGGWWLGLFVFGFYVLALALSIPIAGMAFGAWLFERAGKRHVHVLAALALGLLVFLISSAIPVLNAFVLLAVLLFGLGALTTAAFQNRRAASREVPAA